MAAVTATISTLPPLEATCVDCGGRGSVRLADDREWCGTCNGTGRVPTPVGHAILELVRNQGLR